MTSEPIVSYAERLRGDVARLLDVPVQSVGDEDDLTEQGLDSIRLMSLVNEWNSIGIQLSFAQVVETPTIAAWISALSAGEGEQAQGSRRAGDER